jgi:hypothetical protein
MMWITPEGVALIVVSSGTTPKYVREHTCSACGGWLGKKINTCSCIATHEQVTAVKTPTIHERSLVSHTYGIIEDCYDHSSFP